MLSKFSDQKIEKNYSGKERNVPAESLLPNLSVFLGEKNVLYLTPLPDPTHNT